jgi:hypothetical protein
MGEFTDEVLDLQKGQAIFLGVIGSRNDCNQEKILENVLNPILQELKRTPDKIILPAEGTSTIYISDWADVLKIPSQTYDADWKRHQRRAKFLRDARIQQESTHYLIFLNKRSEFNLKLANRLAKQGHTVFTVASNWEVDELTVEYLHSSSQSQSHPVKGHESIQGIGKEQEQKQLKQSKHLGNQCLLIDLWAT